ncbi:MAG: hypothetical protein R3A46_12610 [Thermomicrobiales bacterium]
MTLHDAQEVRTRLNERIVEDVLQHLGIDRLQSGGPDNWLVSMYRRDSNPDCSVHRETGVFSDLATGDSGDIFKLVMKANVSFPETIELVAKIGGIYPTANNGAGKPMDGRVMPPVSIRR